MSAFFNPISLVHLNYLPFFLSETVEEPKKGFAYWMQTRENKMVVGGGFGPPKAWPVDLQSTAFDRSATPPGNSTWSG